MAHGAEARRLLGRTAADTKVVQPVRGGAISDYEASEHLLGHVLAGVGGRALLRPRVIIAVPTEASEVEKRALQESARAAGAREVVLVSSAISAALGAQLPVFDPVGSMVVNVGGGRTEVAVLSLGGLVSHEAIRLGGEALDGLLVQWLRRQHNLMVGEPTAERIKLEIGAAMQPSRLQMMRVRGRDLSTGAPSTLDLHGGHVAEAISEGVIAIRDTVLSVLANTPPELSADIHGSGVLLVGAAGQLPDLDTVLGEATGLPFLLADAPGQAIARGLSEMLADPELYERAVTEA